MRVLLDAVHPADVWMLGAVEDELIAAGEETLWVSRQGKEAVVELISLRNRPQQIGPQAGTKRSSLAIELMLRDYFVWRTTRDFKPDIILTRSPPGVHAGRFTGTPVIYDSDDGHAVGLLHYLAAPFANMVTSPTATSKKYRKEHRKYRGYKELFYLHPARFTPDPAIRQQIGLAEKQRLFVLRLSALKASHDFGEAGLTHTQVTHILELMQPHGRVVISSEQELPAELQAMRLRTPIESFHQVLAAADLVVGDSQTVCAEAAVLATPSLRFNSWATRLPYLQELQERWQLTKAFNHREEHLFFGELKRTLEDISNIQKAHQQRQQQMLAWAQDPVEKLVNWTYELASR